MRENQGKIGEIMRMIREIDRDRNGYVTVTELDDIFKISFKTQFKNK